MDDELRKTLVRQGMASTLIPIRCPECNYLARTLEEGEQLLRKGEKCPHCGIAGKIATITLYNYIMVFNWIGELAISSNRRDHASATIMFCALVEAIIETLKSDFLGIHTEVALELGNRERVSMKTVFGKTLTQLLNSAPSDIRDFPDEWEVIRNKRNDFLHGHKGDFYITQQDAQDAMDLLPKAIAVLVWLNNHYCIHQKTLAAP
jgi:hypothetical protein